MSLNQVQEIGRRVLQRAGLNKDASDVVAKRISDAERDGCHSHGMFRLPSFVKAFTSGRTNKTSDPELEIRGSSAIVVNANNSFSALAFRKGKTELVSRAKQFGVCAMSIRDCLHYHALWHDNEELADENLVSLNVLTSKSFVAHYGGREMIYGTNPMAFGFPRQKHLPHLIWDQASASMARGEISMCLRNGERLPPDVAIDKNGKMTRDPAKALSGSQLTFGTYAFSLLFIIYFCFFHTPIEDRYKGTAIALMIELLASMCGADFSHEQRECCDDDTSTTPTPCGQFIVAIDPFQFKPQSQSETEFLKRNEMLFERILRDNGRLPSTGKHCGSERMKVRKESELNGVEIPVDLYNECVRLLE